MDYELIEARSPYLRLTVRSIYVLVTLSLISFPGCVGSLDPIFSDDVAISDDDLVGTWIEKHAPERQQWRVERAKDMGYIIHGESRSNSREYEALLVKLGTETYLQLRSISDFKRQESYLDHVIVYNILQVRHTAHDRIELSTFSAEKMEDLMTRLDPVRRPHFIKVDQGKRFLLTGPTKDLQRFVREFGNDLIGSTIVYHRKKDLE